MVSTSRLAPEIALDRLTALGLPRDPQDYPVDGITPRCAVAVSDPQAVAEAAALCAAADLALIPFGGGAQMGLGNLPERYDVALDLRPLEAIVHYEPADLTIAVQAGRSLASLSETLAAHGQMLPIDARDPSRVTIGGLVATGLGCPRRFGHGSLRDLIIGIAVALPDGTIARGGGIVVKNVSGYDMMRLHFGALGSLGVIVQANFKVLPTPESQRTLLITFRTGEQAAEAALRLRSSQLAPTALVVLGPSSAERYAGVAHWLLAARCEGPEGAVTRQVERLQESAGIGGVQSASLDCEATVTFWRNLQGELDASPLSDALRVRLGELPSRHGPLGERLQCELGQDLTGLVLDIGSGLVFATIQGAGNRLLERWRMLSGLGQHATLLAAPPELKAATEVFGRHPEGIGTMRRLKDTFDPQRTLNRGRFIARL